MKRPDSPSSKKTAAQTSKTGKGAGKQPPTLPPDAEAALRESEAKYRLMAENTADIISLLDMNLRFTYVSPAVGRIIGHPPQEYEGKPFDRIMTPDSLKVALAAFAEEMKAETGGNVDPNRSRLIEMEFYRKDGSTIWMESTLSFLRDAEGCTTGIVAVSRDVTERKRFQERLREKSEELTALNRLARAVTAHSSLEKVCQAAVEQVAETLRPDRVLLFLREGEVLNLVAGGLSTESHSPDIPTHRLGECLCGLAADTGSAIYVADVETDPRCTRKECKNAGVRSFGAVPLRLGGKTIGLLGVTSFTGRDFAAAAPYLETAAEEIAIGIHNASLLAEIQAYAARLQQTMAERALSQQALQKRERDLMMAHTVLKNILNAVPVRIFWKDREGRYLGCNPLFARDAGYETPEQVVGKTDAEMGWREQASLYQNDDRSVMEKGVGKTLYEEPQTTPNGETIALLSSKVPLRNAYGKITGVLGTYQDITERKKAEAALRNSEATLNSVFQAVPHAIAVLGPGRVITNVNEATFAVFGYRREEMLGRNSRFLFFSDEEYEQVGRALYAVLSDTHVSTIETRMRHKEGTEICVLLSASPLQADNLQAGAVVAAMDMTERKALDGQLRQSQKMEAIGTLAGGIAHDFNNILSAIMGYTEMTLADPQMSEPLRGYLHQVYRAGERARDLVRQILAFSRQGEGKQQPLRVSPIVKEVLKLLRASLPATIQIRHKIDTEADTVLADVTQIHQILMNLCTNAAHAMSERKGELSIRLESLEVAASDPLATHHHLAAGTYLSLSVADTGIGIAPEIMDRIFDPFFTTKKKD